MATAPLLGHDPPSAGRSTRRAGLLFAQKVLDLLRAAVFAAIVPRLLGPEDFGRFGVLASITFYFALLSGMGTVQLMGRFVPALRHAGDHAAIARLFTGLFLMRTATGVLAGFFCWILLGRWLSDLSALAVGLTAVTVLLRGPANTAFALFLGLDQADRWAAGDTLRRWASLVLVIPGTLMFGLSGALAGVAISELIGLAVGLSWTHPWLSGRVLPGRDEWRSYARYNAMFFAGNAMFAFSQHGTGPLIHAVSGEYEQVAWFAAAHSAYLLASTSLRQLSMSFAPLFSSMRASGQGGSAGALAEKFLLGVGVTGIFATLAAILVGGDVVTLVLGARYEPVGAVLPLLSLAAALGASGQMGRVLALTWDRPRATIAAALAQVATLFLLGPVLVREWGAVGGGLTVLASSGASALFWVAALRDIAPSLGRGVARPLGLALPFLLASTFVVTVAASWRWLALPAVVVAYAATLAGTRVLTFRDLKDLRSALRDATSKPPPAGVAAVDVP